MRLKHLCTALGIAAPYLCNTNPSFKIAAKKLSQPKSRRYAAVGLETRLRAQCTALPRRSPQGDVPGGVGVQFQAGPAAGLPFVVPLAPDHGGVVLPRKLRFPGPPSFFNARDGRAVPPPRFSLSENACTALPRRPICDGAPATTPLTPGRCPGWRRRSAPGRPCGRPSIRSTPGTRSWRRCRRSISARAGTGGRRSPGRRR